MEGEENQNTERKLEPKVTYSVALVMAFLAGEPRKSTTGRFATGRFGGVLERFFL